MGNQSKVHAVIEVSQCFPSFTGATKWASSSKFPCEMKYDEDERHSLTFIKVVSWSGRRLIPEWLSGMSRNHVG